MHVNSSGMADATLFYCYTYVGMVACVEHNYSNFHCNCWLCTLSASNTVIPCTCMWTLLASIDLSPHSYIFYFCPPKFLMNSCLCSFIKACFNKNNCDVVPPTHLQLIRYPSTCTNEWFQQLVCSAPSVFFAKKVHEVSRSYAQNETQKDHPQRIS